MKNDSLVRIKTATSPSVIKNNTATIKNYSILHLP